MPPGAIGGQRLKQGGPLPGYFQPVEVAAPAGALISTASQGGFADPQADRIKLGLLIGGVYRLQITEIPGQEGREVYPTIEVVDRLYPPVGKEAAFPIPVEITAEEIELALDGKFVTRVIYLEDTDKALPVGQDPVHQHYFEARPGENPLEVADVLGRPMAILRMGGRVPEAEGPDEAFLYGCPPLFKYRLVGSTVVTEPAMHVEGPSLRVPRKPLAMGRVSR